MKKLIALFLACLLLISSNAKAEIVTKEIQYKDGDTQLTGFLAYDDAVKAPAPGVLVVHEWWGYNDYVKSRAVQLAKLGYVAFALDMYGTGKLAKTPDEATAMSKPFYDDRGLMRSRALAGLNVLKAQPQVDTARLAVIGYCFGGTVALEVARAGTDVKGVVAFHGGLTTPTPAVPSTVKAQVLALNGGADPFSPQKDKDAFTKEMTSAGVTFKSVDYPDAMHAYTNPAATELGQKFNMPIAYNAAADHASWDEMVKFFNTIFKTTPAIQP